MIGMIEHFLKLPIFCIKVHYAMEQFYSFLNFIIEQKIFDNHDSKKKFNHRKRL